MIVGSGQFKYRVDAEWAKLPDGWSFKEVGGVWVGEADNHGDEANYNRLNHYSSRVSWRHAATRFSRR
jgi:hypothetical protein